MRKLQALQGFAKARLVSVWEAVARGRFRTQPIMNARTPLVMNRLSSACHWMECFGALDRQ